MEVGERMMGVVSVRLLPKTDAISAVGESRNMARYSLGFKCAKESEGHEHQRQEDRYSGHVKSNAKLVVSVRTSVVERVEFVFF